MFAGRPCLADVNDLTNFSSSPHSFNKPADTENKRGSSEVRRAPADFAPVPTSLLFVVPASLYIIPPFFFCSFTLCRLSTILFSFQTHRTPLPLTDLWKCSRKISKHRARFSFSFSFLFFSFLFFPFSPSFERNINFHLS